MKARNGISTLFILCVISGLLVYFAFVMAQRAEVEEKAAYDVAYSQLEAFSRAFSQAVEKYPDLQISAEEFYRRIDTHNNQVYTGPIAEAMNEFLTEGTLFTQDGKSGCYVSAINDPWGGHYVLTLYPFDAEVDHYVPLDDTESIAISIWCSGISERLKEDIRFREHSLVDQTYVGVGVMSGGGLISVDYHCVGRQLPFNNQKICLR